MMLIKSVGLKVLNYCLEKLLRVLEIRSSVYLTIHKRPKKSKDVTTVSDHYKKIPSVGIVIQGPVIRRDNLTLETLKIYKKHFPQVKIILSSWLDADSSQLKEIRKMDISVVLTEKPEIPGLSNINCQILSSYEGVKKAKELGCKYVMKTRSDQRIYSKNTIEYLLNLIKVFPMNLKSVQKERIIVCGFNTFKYRMYSISDMFYFAHIDDMLKFWSCDFDDRNASELKAFLHKPNLTLREFAMASVWEVYLTTSYLKKIGASLKWTLKDSFQKYADYFCIIDKESLDLYWPKYTNNEYRWLSYKKDNKLEEINFRDWLNLYVDMRHCGSVDEKFIDRD